MSTAPHDSQMLLQTMDRTTAVIASASAERLRAVADYDEGRLWQKHGATSMTSWLAARYGLARGTAREWVRVAHALRRLPRIALAYSRGEISWDQLQPLTKFASPETDEILSQRAPELRPSTLWREARRHERVRTREAQDVHRRRYLSLWWDPESPVLYLEGMLGADQGAAVQAALERRAQEVVLEEEAQSPAEARMADALVELVTGGERETAPAATVVVHAGAEVLTREEPDRGPWLAETETGTKLCTDAVRRLACDGRIEWILESVAVPWGSAGGADRSPGPSAGCSATATWGAGSPGASGSGGSRPTTWSTGPTVEPPTWTTWWSCATPITG